MTDTATIEAFILSEADNGPVVLADLSRNFQDTPALYAQGLANLLGQQKVSLSPLDDTGTTYQLARR